jgi:hypothetical protein
MNFCYLAWLLKLLKSALIFLTADVLSKEKYSIWYVTRLGTIKCSWFEFSFGLITLTYHENDLKYVVQVILLLK